MGQTTVILFLLQKGEKAVSQDEVHQQRLHAPKLACHKQQKSALNRINIRTEEDGAKAR